MIQSLRSVIKSTAQILLSFHQPTPFLIKKNPSNRESLEIGNKCEVQATWWRLWRCVFIIPTSEGFWIVTSRGCHASFSLQWISEQKQYKLRPWWPQKRATSAFLSLSWWQLFCWEITISSAYTWGNEEPLYNHELEETSHVTLLIQSLM